MHCAVAFCKMNSTIMKKDGEKISFFKFPRDDVLRRKWIEFCRKQKPFNSECSYICSKHFTKEDIVNNKVEFSVKKELRMPVKRSLKSNGNFSDFYVIFHTNGGFSLIINMF